MTESPVSDILARARAFKAQEAAKKGVTPEPAPVPASLPPTTFGAVGLEDLDLGDVPSNAAQAVNDACNSISIIEVYQRISKNRFERPYKGEQRDGIMISCPDPVHPDNKPSAWINSMTGLYHCGPCGFGGDKYVIAGLAWNMHIKAEFFQIKCRLAKELRGVDYDALRQPVIVDYRQALIASIQGVTNE